MSQKLTWVSGSSLIVRYIKDKKFIIKNKNIYIYIDMYFALCYLKYTKQNLSSSIYSVYKAKPT